MSDPVESSVPESAQFRNGLVFMIAMSLTYLIAPVTYVGVLHATILDSLEASDTVANLPEAVYLWVTPLPLLIAWYWPSPKLLRPMLTWALIVKGAAGALAALVFAFARKRPADHIGPMRHSGRQRLGSRLVRLAGSVVGRRRSTSRR